MANITIPDLPLVTGMVDGTELFETVQPGDAQNGVSKSIVITDLLKAIGVLNNLTLPVSSDLVAVFRPSTSEIYNAEISALGLPLGNLPVGGTTGQYLAKNSNADYDTGWYTLPTFGTVTSFSAGNLSPLFTTSVATATTTPALSFSLSNAAANTYFGNATGGAAAPSYTAAGALTKVDDTNVTLTLGGAPTTALLTAASLTLGWTGQLGLTRGGTAASLTASNGGLVYSTASALAILAGTATAGQIPLSGSSAAPSWSTATYPSTAVAGTVMTAATANTFTASATPTLGISGSVLGTLTFAGNTSGSVTIQSAAAAGSWTLTLPTSGGTSGYVLSTNGSGVTSWVAAGSGSPGGSDTQLQYNNAGGFGGITGATTNGTVVTLTSALATTAFSPSSNDGAALGTTALQWSDLFAASGAVLNFNNGNYTITHSAGLLTFSNAATISGTVTGNTFVPTSSSAPTNGLYLPAANTLGWAINSAAEMQLTATALSPAVDGGNSLGTTALGWQNLFGNTGFVWNIENGDWVATHTAGILTVGTGDLRVTTAGTNTASVATVGGTQTFTNKTLTSSTNVLGGVTTTLGSDATGDIYYRNSGGVLTRLAIGSSGQVLTVSAGLPSWAAAGGGGSYVLISKQTASSSASLAWTALDTSTYDSFEVVFENILGATAGTNLYIQVGTSTGPTWQTSSYGNYQSGLNSAVECYNEISNTSVTNATSTPGFSGNITIGNLAGTSFSKPIRGYGTHVGLSGNSTMFNLAGVWNSTTAITSLRLIMSSGNITSGFALLYGRKNT